MGLERKEHKYIWRERSTNILCIMGNSNEKLIYISKLKQVLLSGLTGPKFSER